MGNQFQFAWGEADKHNQQPARPTTPAGEHHHTEESAATLHFGERFLELLRSIHKLGEEIQQAENPSFETELRQARRNAYDDLYAASRKHTEQFGCDSTREAEAWALEAFRREYGLPTPEFPPSDADPAQTQARFPVVVPPQGQGNNDGGRMLEQTELQPERPRTREEKHHRIEQMTDHALGELGEALAAGKSERLTQYLSVMAKFHHYSFGNVLLIMIQRPDATHVAGFHKWKEFGRSVKKGEHGIVILAPVTRKIAELEEQHSNGSIETRDVRRIVNVKPVYVFDVTQTDGKELPRFAKTAGDPADNTMHLKSLLTAKGITLEYTDSLGGALGRSEGGKISCLNGLAPADEFHTLVHEVAHELLHRGERRNETTRRTRELEAEAVAFVVCSAVGLSAKEASTDYIHLYQGSKEKLAESLHFIRAVAGEILAAVLQKQTSGAGD